jgi:hypothetical protein
LASDSFGASGSAAGDRPLGAPWTGRRRPRHDSPSARGDTAPGRPVEPGLAGVDRRRSAQTGRIERHGEAGTLHLVLAAPHQAAGTPIHDGEEEIRDRSSEGHAAVGRPGRPGTPANLAADRSSGTGKLMRCHLSADVARNRPCQRWRWCPSSLQPRPARALILRDQDLTLLVGPARRLPVGGRPSAVIEPMHDQHYHRRQQRERADREQPAQPQGTLRARSQHAPGLADGSTARRPRTARQSRSGRAAAGWHSRWPVTASAIGGRAVPRRAVGRAATRGRHARNFARRAGSKLLPVLRRLIATTGGRRLAAAAQVVELPDCGHIPMGDGPDLVAGRAVGQRGRRGLHRIKDFPRGAASKNCYRTLQNACIC